MGEVHKKSEEISKKKKKQEEGLGKKERKTIPLLYILLRSLLLIFCPVLHKALEHLLHKPHFMA